MYAALVHPAKGNSSAWNNTTRNWLLRSGYLTGTTFGNGEMQPLTFADAKSICANAAECGGFNFIDVDAAPSPSKVPCNLAPCAAGLTCTYICASCSTFKARYICASCSTFTARSYRHIHLCFV